MALQIRAVKQKIGSVKNIRKITKAMEMVAVSKMKKAVQTALATRGYSELGLELLSALSREKQLEHILMEEGKGNRTLMLVIATNRGLCGGFNVVLAKATVRQFEAYGGRDGVDFVTVGKNAERLAKKLGATVVGSFIDFSQDISIDDIGGLSRLVLDAFKSGKYARVLIVNNNYISAIKYEPVVRTLLPIKPEILKNMLHEVGPDRETINTRAEMIAPYIFEPNEEELLDIILPLLTKVYMYQALLESAASEHSARMFAMKNASDSAGRIVDDLTLDFNHARQDGITKEISEIAAGADAMS